VVAVALVVAVAVLAVAVAVAAALVTPLSSLVRKAPNSSDVSLPSLFVSNVFISEVARSCTEVLEPIVLMQNSPLNRL